MTKLVKKTIWITGASSGIGEQLTYQLAAKDNKLIISARRKEVLEQVRANCMAKAQENIYILPLDLSDIPSLDRIASAALKLTGGIDVLINNGAILTMNSDNDVIENGSIAIKENQIVGIGTSKDIQAKYIGEKTVDASDTVIIPGLIDTHFHTAQQFERGLIGYISKGKKLKEPFWLNYLISYGADYFLGY